MVAVQGLVAGQLLDADDELDRLTRDGLLRLAAQAGAGWVPGRAGVVGVEDCVALSRKV